MLLLIAGASARSIAVFVYPALEGMQFCSFPGTIEIKKIGTEAELGSSLPRGFRAFPDHSESGQVLNSGVSMNIDSTLERAIRLFNAGKTPGENIGEIVTTFGKFSDKEARAAFYLGACFDEGFGVRVNRTKALQYYEKAAQANHGEAAYNAYLMHRDGVGTRADTGRAMYWLKISTESGDNAAIRDLGWHHHEGIGVRKDFKKAAALYRRAAKAGDAIAQWNLGCCYNDGQGVKHSARWSDYWMKKAALQGHVAAKEFLTLVGKRRARA